ncbi:MAG: stage II sporulation protein M [Candidatus Diapherotrites archaeon]
MLAEWFQRLGFKNTALFFAFIGFVYALVGIGLATIVFSSSIGLVAVFFVSLALMASMGKLLNIAELLEGRKEEIRRKNVYLEEVQVSGKSLSVWDLLEDYKDLFQAYAFSFFGIFFAFALVTIFLPSGMESQFFGNQLGLLGGAVGGAIDVGNYLGIVSHNLLIMGIVFAISLIFEFGTTFVVAWNASVWGAVFAFRAKQAALLSQSSPLLAFASLMAIVILHTALEASAYFSGAIAGGILNRGFLRERWFGDRFNQIALHALLILVVGIAFVLVAGAVEVFWAWPLLPF